MQHTTVIWFNFGDLGLEGWFPIEILESELMLAAAESLIERFETEEVWEIIQRQKAGLEAAVLVNQINEEWISQAVLYRALCGLMGQAIPDVRYLT